MKAEALTAGRFYVENVRLGDAISSRTELWTEIPIYYSANGDDYFQMEHQLKFYPDLIIDHVELSGTQPTKLIDPGPHQVQVIAYVKNAREDIVYFCDIQGLSKVVKATLKNKFDIETNIR